MMIRSTSISLKKMQGSCHEIAALLKALSHPERLLVLGRLARGASTVSDLVENSGISQSQMSHFLSRLKLEGLVQCERQGKFRIYSLADPRLARLLRVIQEEYCRS